MLSGPLIGRESELIELEGTLGDARLLTVTGAGGCGKTRVALALAERLASPELECVTVLLAGIGKARLIDELLAAVGARERFGSARTSVLLERLASRPVLLAIDNCEHLIPALRPLLTTLLDGAPSLRVLATSREPLAIDGEAVYRLQPLGTPEPDGGIDAIVRADAGRLFVDRAARSDLAFALTPASAPAVSAICRELDGLPLALCLAAARLDMHSVDEIAAGLTRHGRLTIAAASGERPRQLSLRASLDWSYQLLDDRERVLLRRLAVFRGGFTSAAAGAVAGDPCRVDSDLQALEAKGLLLRTRAGERERWSMLQTVAEYATEQLERTGEQEEVADRHLAFFVAYAPQADTLLLQSDAHALIDQDAANLRAALDRAVEHDPPAALQIAASLMRHWVLAEHFEQARSTAATVLAAIGEDGDAGPRALVLCGGGVVSLLSEDYEGAISSTGAGLDLLDEIPDTATKATCLHLSSMVLIQTGVDLAEGLANAEQAVALTAAGEDPLGRAFALVTLAVAAGLCDRFDASIGAYEEFLTIPKACEHPRLRTWGEQAAAWAQVSAGSPERALVHTERALALEGQWPSMTHFQVLGFRIQALARTGHADQALAQGALALDRARQSGALQAVPAIELAVMLARFMNGDHDAARDCAGRLLDMPQLHTLVLVHDTLGRIALARGDQDEARCHARELRALAARSASARQQALADYISGRAAILTGEHDDARDLLHAGLERCAQLGLERDAADVLDELAHLAASGGDVERAARNAGAATAARSRLGCVQAPDSRKRLEALQARIAKDGQADCWEAAWAQGATLALPDIVAYLLRRRGSRERPASGWASLTSTEHEVADLATQGITNAQIAERMFIARSTVKMHLSNIYRKLGIANRIQLAALSTRAPGHEQTTLNGEKRPKSNQGAGGLPLRAG